ncbi:MAG TPA: glycosyltransferase [Gryllotalpicola sp.]
MAAASAVASRLSVVIPARNEAAIIDDCLSALVHQSDPVDEIIVVDNGSTDSTAERAAAYPGVTVLYEAVPGIGRTRALGFDAASGDIIARIDADTIVDAGWAAALRSAFRNDPALAAVAGDVRQSHAGSALTRLMVHVYGAFRVFHRTLFGAKVLLYGHNMALRREAWEAIRPLVSVDEQVNEDIDVALAIRSLGGRMRFEPQVRAQVDLLRTLSPRKLVRYLRRDSVTRRKYELVAAEAASGA